jgi:tetratricopeptide (TPR) repeat protein
MLESLLKTEDIPSDLRRFVQDKTEGNPFYLEELVNSLIDSGTLIRHNGSWRLLRNISELVISPTIHGVISGRLDRLEKQTKRILQEASVIGRNFLYEILAKVTDRKHDIDQRLGDLEQLDLIRTRSLQPDLEYMFKHALTQEVVYNALLKEECREIHERIALVMEKLFQDRLPEFYETLAFHFKQSQLIPKAVDYLIRSGEKSWERYALEESHQYYKESFDLLFNKSQKTKEELGLFIDLLNKWALVYDRRGDFVGLIDLLKAHEKLAESLGDKEKLGLLRAWLGYSFRQREKLKESYQYLTSALELGEEIQNKNVIAHASSWLCWTCADLGFLDKALAFGKKAQEICLLPKPDLNLYRSSLWGMGLTYYFRGEGSELDKVGENYISFGERLSDPRFITEGHTMFGLAELLRGDALSATEYFQKAARTSIDPFVTYSIMLFLGMSFLSNDRPHEAQNVLEEVNGFSEKFGIETMGTPSQFFLGLVSITKGNLKQGIRICEKALRSVIENESRYRHATGEYLLGKIYVKIVQGEGPMNLSFLLKNFGFLLKNVPFANQKAEKHLLKAIQVAKQIGANSILGQAYFDLGRLHNTKGRTDQAKKCLCDAVKLFEQCEAVIFLKQAKDVLASL